MNEENFYLIDYQIHEDTKRELGIYFNSYGVKLVPIELDSFVELIKKSHETLIIINNSLAKENYFKKVKRKFLNLAVMTNKLNLVEFSSFKSQHSKILNLRNYRFYELPISTSKVADLIFQNRIEFLKNKNRWPGGRQSRVSIKALM